MRVVIRLLILGLAWSCTYAEPPPIRAFIEPAQFKNPKLSPRGDRFAVVGIRDFAEFVALIDVGSMQASPVALLSDGRVLNYWWKGDRYLLLLIEHPGETIFKVVDMETRKARDLTQLNMRGGWVVNPLVGDPESMIVSSGTSSGVDLRKLNLRTGKLELLERNPGFVRRWFTDRTGRAVAGLGLVDENWFMVLRVEGKRPWRRVELGNRSVPDFWPIAVYSDQRRILGLDYVSGNTAAAVVWDPADDRKETIWHSDEVDPDSVLNWGDDETVPRAIAFETDRPRYHYLDAGSRALAEQIDAALPDTTNSIVSMSADESRMIIQSESDTVAAEFFLLDRNTGSLRPLGRAFAGLDPKQMGSSRHFAFDNRAGQRIRGRILVPRGAPDRPPVVVAVGHDLSSRSQWRFQRNFQLLASAGYATVEIDHRGTDGYGRAFAEAGDRQISEGMPDDIADGVRWLVEQGWIDGRRVAILGQDDGGILALHTLVRHPGLFSAWININTPMSTRHLEADDVVFGLHSNESRLAKIGGERSANRYTKSLEPKRLLPSVRVPSFAFYSRRRDNSLFNDGGVAERHFERAGLPYTFRTGPNALTRYTTIEEAQKILTDSTATMYEDLIKFLNEHLR